MSTAVSFNGSSFSVPAVGEEDWGGATKVDGLLISLANNALAKSGGTFTLTAEVDFGGTAGLKALSYKSRGTNVSSTGILRLANAESVGWRNAANGADILLTVDSSDRLTFGGVVVLSSAGIVQVAAGGTGIASYTSGDLLYATGSTTLSKLAIGSANTVLASDGSAPSWRTIVNADVNASAAIARTKLASGSASHVLINDGSGVVSSEATLAVSRGGTNLASYTTGDVIYASGATTLAKLGIGTSGQVIRTNSGATAPEWGAALIAGGGTGVTSYTAGDLLYFATGTALSKLAIGTAGQVLKTNAGATAPEWGAAASSLAVAAKIADYTLLSTDDFITVDSDADANGFTITLPDNATNTGKVYTIKRIGTTFATARAVTVARAGSDTITDSTSGLTSTTLNTPGEEIQIVSLGTGVWQIIQRRIPSVWTSYTPTIDLTGGATTGVGFWRRVGDSIEVRADFTFTTVFTGGTPETNIPTGLTFDTAKIPGTEVGATVPVLGMAHCYDVGSDVYVASAIYASTTGVVCRIYIDDAGTSSGYVATANAISTTNPFTWANNDRMLFYYTAPVTGWNG